MAYIPASGSVLSFPGANQSVSGLVGASIIGIGISSQADGGSSSQQLSTNDFNRVFNGSNWDRWRGDSSIGGLVNTGAGSTITVSQGSIAAVIIGSIATTFPSNQSVSGTVGASIIGQVPTFIIGGSILAQQTGARVTSVISSVPSSMLSGASIFGQLPAGTAVLGSVAVLQGTNPWNISSVYGNISGSVLAFQAGMTVTSISGTLTIGAIVSGASIIGTYSEDVPSSNNDKGLFTLGVRNDTLSSLVSADGDYTGWGTDSAGRHLIKPFVSEDGTIISYTGSVVSGSVTLIQGSAIGKRNYVTDFFVVNTGSVAQLVTFQGGDTSILGYTIAPAGGGSNAPGIAIPLKTTLAQDLAFKITGTSSVIYMTVKGYQAQ